MGFIANNQPNNHAIPDNTGSRDDLALVLSNFTDDETAFNLSDQTNHHKAHSIETSKFLSNDKIKKCSNYIDLIGKSIVSLTRCNQHKYCLTCNHKRSNQLYYAIQKRVDKILQKHPNINAYHLILTGGKTVEFSSIKNRLKKINEGFTRLRKGLEGSILGYIKCNEISESKGKAHPHSHIIILSNTELFRDDLERQWTKILESKSGRIKIDLTQVECKGESLGSLVKYASKAIVDPRNKIQNFNLKTIADQLHKSRLLSTGGLFKGVFQKEARPAINANPQFKFDELSKRYNFTIQEKNFEDELTCNTFVASSLNNFEDIDDDPATDLSQGKRDRQKQLEFEFDDQSKNPLNPLGSSKKEGVANWRHLPRNKKNNTVNQPLKADFKNRSIHKSKSKPKQLEFKFVRPPKTPHWVRKIKQGEHPLTIQAGPRLKANKKQLIYYYRTDESTKSKKLK